MITKQDALMIMENQAVTMRAMAVMMTGTGDQRYWAQELLDRATRIDEYRKIRMTNDGQGPTAL